MTHESESTYLFGAIAVEATLSAGTREVRGVWVDGELDFRKIEPVRRAAKARRMELVPQTRDELAERCGTDKHAGVVAEVGPRQFVSLQAMLEMTGDERCFIVMLDGIEDPFNFGQSIRSLYAAGCHGVVVRPRNWFAPDAPVQNGQLPGAVIARASAGTSEFMPIALAESPDEAAAFFGEKGLTVAATADTTEATPLYDVDLKQPLFLLIGGEKRGVKRSFLKEAGLVIEVPYSRPFEHSLGTVAAVSVVGFELARQRGVKQIKR